MLPITPGTRTVERKARDSNPQAARAAACFQDRFLIRPDAFRPQAAGAGIEPTSRRMRAPRPTVRRPRIVSFLETRVSPGKLGEKVSNLHFLVQSQVASR
jgi:hypothetical protein